VSLLTIVRNAALQVGLSPPTTVASSADRTAQEMLMLANKVGRDVARWHDWSTMLVDATITGNGVDTTWALPADFSHFTEGQRVILDGGAGIIITGPLSESEIVALRATNPVMISHLFYRRGSSIVTSPAIGAGRLALYSYRSKNWAASSTGTAKNALDADTDIVRFPEEELVTLGVIWRWKAMKGLDYGQEYEDWRQACQIAAARDGSLQPVAAGPAMTELPDPITPDTIVVAP
jgi:hypothetical protein